MSDKIARAIAGEEQLSSGSQQSSRAAAFRIVGMPPHDFSGPVVDRGEGSSARTDVNFLLPAQAHRSARIEVGEIKNRVSVVLGNIEQTRIRGIGGRLPIDCAV